MSQLDIFRKVKRYMPFMEVVALNLKKAACFNIDLQRPEDLIVRELKSLNIRYENILFRPTVDYEPYYLMADDLDQTAVKRYWRNPDGTYRPGRMITETSPGNYQMWIHFDSPMGIEMKLHFLSLMGSDSSAGPKGRLGRFPSYTNRKPIHCRPDGSFPMARLIWVDWMHKAQNPSSDIFYEGANVEISKPRVTHPLSFPTRGGRVS